jgi:hypothetical protein
LRGSSGLAEGTKAEQWLEELRSDEYYGALFEAHLVPTRDRQTKFDIFLHDHAAKWPPVPFISSGDIPCVMALGDRPSAQLLEVAVETGAAIAAGIPTDNVQWFHAFLNYLARDRPLDVALALAVPNALVASPPGLINATGAGHWARRFAESWRLPSLAEQLSGLSFESIGTAYEVVDAINRQFPGGRASRLYIRTPATPPWVTSQRAGDEGPEEWGDYGAAFDFDYASYGEPAGWDSPDDAVNDTGNIVDDDEPLDTDRAIGEGKREQARTGLPTHCEPPVPPPPSRQLTAYITCDGQLCERVLVPEREHKLEILITVPKDDDRGAIRTGADFPNENIPSEAGPVARLTVDVWSDDGSVHASQDVNRPMTDRTRDSTPAIFKFQSGQDGSPITVHITVLYQGRPLQAAVLSATARAEASLHDHIEMLLVPLSAAPEPSDGLTPADATLEFTEQSLRRLNTDEPQTVPMTGVQELASAFEEVASSALGTDEAFQNSSSACLALASGGWAGSGIFLLLA